MTDERKEVMVRLRYHPSAVTPGGVSTEEELVMEIDRAMNASHFGGLIDLEIHADKQFKLICLPEGELQGVESFNTKTERTVFTQGFYRGAACYGAGNVYLIEWENLGNPEAFEEEFGEDIRDTYPGTLAYTFEELRKRVGWKEDE